MVSEVAADYVVCSVVSEVAGSPAVCEVVVAPGVSFVAVEDDLLLAWVPASFFDMLAAFVEPSLPIFSSKIFYALVILAVCAEISSSLSKLSGFSTLAISLSS